MRIKNIFFFTEAVDYKLRNKEKIRDWINASIVLENKEPGSINYIFCSDNYLHKLNLEHLNHDTLTDIITFNNSESDHIISSDLFISIDRIRENSKQYQVSIVNELHRVMIHGILHLIGFNDKTEEEKMIMRSKEDYYLTLLSESLRE